MLQEIKNSSNNTKQDTDDNKEYDRLKLILKMSVKNEDGQYPYLMIGEELRYLLKASGVSLKMIADHAGMSNTTIQTLLKGGM